MHLSMSLDASGPLAGTVSRKVRTARGRYRLHAVRLGLGGIERGFRKRGPWVTRFTIGGRTYGGDVDLPHDVLIEQFAARTPSGASVLELGSLEGGHSFALAARGYRITAIEGRRANIKRARYVAGLLGDRRTRFVHANLESEPLAGFGHFECVLCAGLLYHLPEPWLLIDQLAEVASRLFLRTHYSKRAELELEGLRGHWHTEGGEEEPLSGLSPRSFWPTLPSLLGRLERGGFEYLELIDFPENPHGPQVVLWATTKAAGPE